MGGGGIWYRNGRDLARRSRAWAWGIGGYMDMVCSAWKRRWLEVRRELV